MAYFLSKKTVKINLYYLEEQNFVVVLENQRMVVNKDDRTTYDKSRNSSNDRALNSLDIFQVINQFIGEEIEKESCQCQKEYINKYLRSICNYSKNRTNRFYGRRNLERSNMIFDLSKSMNVRKSM